MHVEVDLDIPLTCVGDDLEYRVLPPNSMILERHISLPDDSLEGNSDNWKKRKKYVRKGKGILEKMCPLISGSPQEKV